MVEDESSNKNKGKFGEIFRCYSENRPYLKLCAKKI